LRALQQSRLFDSNAVRLAERIRILNQELADLALYQSHDRTPEEVSKRATCREYEIHWQTLEKILIHIHTEEY